MVGLIKYIDELVEEYIAADEPKSSGMKNLLDFDPSKLLDDGLFPASNPLSLSRKPLYSICITLGCVGGDKLISGTLVAYGQRYGRDKMIILQKAWNMATDVWKSY